MEQENKTEEKKQFNYTWLIIAGVILIILGIIL